MAGRHCPMTSARDTKANVSSDDYLLQEQNSGTFFSAAEARRRVREVQTDFIKKIYSEGIIPAVKAGKDRCVVKVVEEGVVPSWVISFLEGLGYTVENLRVRTPEGSLMFDRTSLEISWNGCEIHEPEK